MGAGAGRHRLVSLAKPSRTSARAGPRSSRHRTTRGRRAGSPSESHSCEDATRPARTRASRGAYTRPRGALIFPVFLVQKEREREREKERESCADAHTDTHTNRRAYSPTPQTSPQVE
jgi:hypothetical protein